MTENALKKAKEDLFNITSNHALKNYLQMNPKPTIKKKKPYGLGFETLEALEHYKLVYGKSADEINKETEEQLKAFLLPYRTTRTEYLVPIEK